MAKEKRKDTRTTEEKEGYANLIQAGLNFYNTSAMGDTSQISDQAAGFENYAISQGIDPEKDLNGLPRQVKLFGKLIPKEQETAKQKLLEATESNFAYALNGLNSQTAVGLAAKLGITEKETILEKKLSTPNTELKDIKTAFTELYEPSSLLSNYVELNINKDEVTKAAYGALDRAIRRRQSEFMYMEKDKTIIYEGRKAKAYIKKNMTTADEEIATEVKMEIGSQLAMNIIMEEQKKAEVKQKKSKK